MKAKQRTLVLLLAALFTIGFQHIAHAHYDPGLQRWVNRDPVGDKGFRSLPASTFALAHRPVAEHREVPNLYEFVTNDPISSRDPWGLAPIKIPIKFWRQCGFMNMRECRVTCYPQAVKQCLEAVQDGQVVEVLCQCSTVEPCHDGPPYKPFPTR